MVNKTNKDCGPSPNVPNSIKNATEFIGEGGLNLKYKVEYKCADGYFKVPYSESDPTISYECETAGSWPAVTFECFKSEMQPFQT